MKDHSDDRVHSKRPQKKKKIFTRKMQIRFLWVFGTTIALFLFLVGRIFFLNAKHYSEYSNAVLSHQSYVNTNIPYQRGEITDRNGTVIATNIVTYNVILDPSVTNANDGMYVEPTIEALVQAFNDPKITSNNLHDILQKNEKSQYYILLKDRTYEEVSTFKHLQEANHKYVKGVWFETVYTRDYPYGSLASHVIGFVKADNSAANGIELQYDQYLVGRAGRESGYYDSELNLVKRTWPAEDGATVVSTIDVAVQTQVEKHIKEFNETMGCKNIGVVVMNPNNGEIYAMASNEGYDLNNPRDLESYLSEEELAEIGDDDEKRAAAMNALWRNFCVSDTYEPGSTFKCVTVSSALEEGVATPESTYYCAGVAELDTYKIHCNNRSGHKTLTLEQSLMNSCNMAMIDIAGKLGKDTFRSYQERFGFGYRTGIDLPGEAKGILVDAQNLNLVELATSSFGQGFNVTMVQMAAAYSSIVNGGYYYTPHVVKKVVNQNGATVYEAKNTISARTVSKSTVEFMRQATLSTVAGGTAKPAQVEGYLVGGKTGTAQKGRRADGKYIVSFIGSVPADNPQVVIYVVIDEVNSDTLYNSSKPATELTSAILKDILPHLGMYPSTGEIDYGVEYTGDQIDEIGTTIEEPEEKQEQEQKQN